MAKTAMMQLEFKLLEEMQIIKESKMNEYLKGYRHGLLNAANKANELLATERNDMVNFGNDLLAQQDSDYIGVPDLADKYFTETYTDKHNG